MKNMYNEELIKDWKAVNDALKSLSKITSLTWCDELDDIYWSLMEQEELLRNTILYSDNVGIVN